MLSRLSFNYALPAWDVFLAIGQYAKINAC